MESYSRDHLLQFDHSPDQECGAVLPVQLLYDDGYEVSVAGFTWQHFFMIGALPRWPLFYFYLRCQRKFAKVQLHYLYLCIGQ